MRQPLESAAAAAAEAAAETAFGGEQTERLLAQATGRRKEAASWEKPSGCSLYEASPKKYKQMQGSNECLLYTHAPFSVNTECDRPEQQRT